MYSLSASNTNLDKKDSNRLDDKDSVRLERLNDKDPIRNVITTFSKINIIRYYVDTG